MYLFLNVPEISRFQWHPFTITSTPEEGFISVHIRLLGNWCHQLANLVGAFKQGVPSQNHASLPALRVDGPFGAPAEDLYDYRVACLIGAGIGVTPAASLLKSIWYRHYRKAPMSLEKVYFVWVNREKEAFEWFQSLLSTIEDSVPRSFLEIHVYLTGKLDIDDIQNVVLNSANDVDPVTELRNKCHFGRPNFSRLFQGIASNCSHGQTENVDVGVFFCGPGPLAAVVADACVNETSGMIKFSMRKEHF